MNRAHRHLLLATAVAGIITLAGCASAAPTIAGTWSPSDGTPTKIIGADGECSGMYYSGGQPLDIGGGMTCALSSTATDGQYTLTVRQPPNQTSYGAVFDGDTLTLTSGGSTVVVLTRE